MHIHQVNIQTLEKLSEKTANSTILNWLIIKGCLTTPHLPWWQAKFTQVSSPVAFHLINPKKYCEYDYTNFIYAQQARLELEFETIKITMRKLQEFTNKSTNTQMYKYA